VIHAASVPTSILSLLFLMAIGQGLFLAATLLLSRQPAVRGANRLLSALLLVCVAIIGHAWLGINGLYQTYPHSALAVATLGLLTGPLLYLYLGSMLFDRPLGRRQLLHAIPFAVATLALLPFYLQPAGAKLAWMVERTGPPAYLALAAVAKLVFFLIYIGASHRLMQKVEAGPLAQGLRRLLIVWLAGGVLSVAALAIEFADVPMAISADAVGALALLCFVYATAFLAIRLPLGYRPQPEPDAAPKPRYANSLMPEEARSGFLAKLAHSMEQRELFRNGELKLEELAAELAMTVHELSQLINDACGVNFQDYLNRFRVEALKASLLDPGNGGATILDLAMAAGFNSKSAFNRAFKKHTGMTPSEFRRAESSFATQSGD
jgi:AraC-like DNA-binding protein